MVRDRQSLSFKDSATGVDVTLVGTMHYNPVSIELASSTVTRLREADALHAVVLESCPSRWKKTQKTQPPGSFLRWFLYNEMLAAADAAGDPTKIRLGDQRIEDLGACAKRTMADTARDVLDPLGGGWGRLVRDWRDGFKKEIDGRGDSRGNLRAADLWCDVALLLGMPVSMFRYPMAWAIKSPKVIVPFAAFAWGIERIPSLVRPGGDPRRRHRRVRDERGGAVGERAVPRLRRRRGGLHLQALPQGAARDQERRVEPSRVLAIRDACEESARSGDGGGVVAVLGAAHLNGVQLRLMGDGDDEWWVGAGREGGSGEGAGEDVAAAEAPSR